MFSPVPARAGAEHPEVHEHLLRRGAAADVDGSLVDDRPRAAAALDHHGERGELGARSRADLYERPRHVGGRESALVDLGEVAGTFDAVVDRRANRSGLRSARIGEDVLRLGGRGGGDQGGDRCSSAAPWS